jgi:DNA-binding transcriptional regulator YhcF (GntR family)
MQDITEKQFLGTVLRLLASGEMTLGRIVNSTRHFRKRRRINDDVVFSILRRFVENGVIGQTIRKGRIAFVSKSLEEMANRVVDENKPDPTEKEMAKVRANISPELIEESRRIGYIEQKLSDLRKAGKAPADEEKARMYYALEYNEIKKNRESRTIEKTPEEIIAESIAKGEEAFK